MSFRRVQVLIDESEIEELRSIVEAAKFGHDSIAARILKVALLQASAQLNNPSKPIVETLPQRGILDTPLLSPTELAESLSPLASVMANRLPDGQQRLRSSAIKHHS